MATGLFKKGGIAALKAIQKANSASNLKVKTLPSSGSHVFGLGLLRNDLLDGWLHVLIFHVRCRNSKS